MKSPPENLVAENANWSPDGAYLCFVSLIFAQIVTNALFLGLFRHDPFLRSVKVLLMHYLISGIILLSITIWHTHPSSFTEFIGRFGFLRPGLKGAVAALLSGCSLGLAAQYAVHFGLAPPQNAIAHSFYGFGLNGANYFRLLAITFPLVEETIVRGYFYKAFRRGYSVLTSVTLVAAISIMSHFAIMSGVFSGAIFILALNILTSLLRERTQNIWNCIFCHVVYNFVCVIK
ncbi:MAG TPA: CPBP family intramembrane glutamic endopeptidase [Verrucomicrobiae bacterium]|jgi:membrane protease YdiL (CAAX protease family)